MCVTPIVQVRTPRLRNVKWTVHTSRYKPGGFGVAGSLDPEPLPAVTSWQQRGPWEIRSVWSPLHGGMPWDNPPPGPLTSTEPVGGWPNPPATSCNYQIRTCGGESQGGNPLAWPESSSPSSPHAHSHSWGSPSSAVAQLLTQGTQCAGVLHPLALMRWWAPHTGARSSLSTWGAPGGQEHGPERAQEGRPGSGEC